MAKKERVQLRRWLVFSVIIVLLGLLTGYMRVCASVVHVRHTDVYLADLPASFDGTTILYIADPDVYSDASLERTVNAVKRLTALKPDLLLLGGDYTGKSLWNELNRQPDAECAEQRGEWMEALAKAFAAYQPPLGKYAAAGEDDVTDGLSMGGVTLLRDEAVALTRGNGRILLAGLSSASESATELNSVSGKIKSDECVIAFAHSSAALTGIQISEANGGGQWVDLALFGKTHGGQIRLFGHNLISLSPRESLYTAGWYRENGIKLLVSGGLGCEGINLRLGSASEVHFLTLRRGDTM